MMDAHDFVNDPRLKTVRELDQRHKLPKDAAFRVCKRLEPRWVMGEHLWCCDPRRQPEACAELQRRGSVYPSTINAVLISEAECRLMVEAFEELRQADPAYAGRE